MHIVGMKKEIHQRLQLARQAAGFENPAQAARRFGWKEPTYYAHENGSRGIRRDLALIYARAFKVSPLWLIAGQGEMKMGKRQPKIEEVDSLLEDCDEGEIDIVIDVIKSLKKRKNRQ